jgi:hypothetical protein
MLIQDITLDCCLVDLQEDRRNTYQSDSYKRLYAWLCANDDDDINHILENCYILKDELLRKCGVYPTFDKFCDVLLEELKSNKPIEPEKEYHMIQFSMI